MNPSQQPPNQRSAPRLPAPAAVWLQCRRDRNSGNLANGVLNLSAAGVQFLAREPLATGEIVALTLSGAAVPSGVHRRGEVRWVVELGGGACCAGVRFLESLAEADLQILLGRGQSASCDILPFDPLDDSIPAIDLPLM